MIKPKIKRPPKASEEGGEEKGEAGHFLNTTNPRVSAVIVTLFLNSFTRTFL